jgi:hypothetical protein
VHLERGAPLRAENSPNTAVAELRPDYGASIAFLRRVHNGRRWTLTAILPDEIERVKKTVTATFDATREADCLKWLEKYGAKRNVYWSVAELLYDMNKKAERTDVARVHFLHVDLDPNTGEPIPEERARILATLQGTKRPDVLPGKIPAPSLIVDSGGGYQGFWELSDPIEIGGDIVKAEDEKGYNLAIEVALGADSCHNIDRVMRLPGTINRPSRGKLAKGRTERLAAVVPGSDIGIKYGQDRFSKAHVANVESSNGIEMPASGKTAPNLNTAKVVRLDSLEDLPQTVPAWAKALINIGFDPNNPHPLLPKKYASRSEALFAVVCALHRARVSDDTIYSVLTDDRFGISSSVLDKGSKAEKYATRQIARAKVESANPMLEQMNGRFAVIGSIGGKCRVIEEQHDELLNRSRVVKQSFEDFQNRFMNIDVPCGSTDDGKPVVKPLGLWWLKQPFRRQLERIVFIPNRDTPDDYNLWRGYGCKATPGEIPLFLHHLKSIICRGNEDHYRYLLGWFADAVQNPAKPAGVAVVLKGGEGTGKGFVARTFGRLLGRHYLQISNPKHLVGNFNAHLRDCVVLFADEAFYAGNPAHEALLKTLVTEPMLMIEGKGLDAENAANFLHIIMATNSEWAIPAGVDARRFFVLSVSKDKAQQKDYFAAIQAELDDGGYEALLHFLMSYDLAGFNVSAVPKTDELRVQKAHSLALPEQVMLDCITQGITPGDDIDKANAGQFCVADFQKAAKFATPTAAIAWLKKHDLIDPDNLRDFPSGFRRNVFFIPVRPELGRFPTLDCVPSELRGKAERCRGKTVRQFRPLGTLRVSEPWASLLPSDTAPGAWMFSRDIGADLTGPDEAAEAEMEATYAEYQGVFTGMEER